MATSSEYQGKTLDEAVKKGLQDLGLSRAEAMITVIEEGSGGFLGFGARPYRVRIMARPGGPFREPDERGRREGAEGRGRRGGRGRDDRPPRTGRAREERAGRGPRVERAAAGRRPEVVASGGAPRREESRRDEPRRDEPRRDEPRRDEPRRDEPRRDPPRREGSRREESHRDAPRRDERREGFEDRRSDERHEPPRGGERRDGGTDDRRQDDHETSRGPEPTREPRPAPIDAMAGAAPRSDAGEGGDDAGRRRRRRGRRGGRGRGGEERGPRVARPGEAENTEVIAMHEESPAFPERMEPTERVEHADRMEPAELTERADRADRIERTDRVERVEHSDRMGRTEGTEEHRPRREAPAHTATLDREPALSNEALAAEGKRWTEELLRAMGFEAKVTATAQEDRVDVTAEVSQNDELLTGPKGEVRQALQHLLNRMINRGEGSRYHLQLEINDFWKRREDELRDLAHALAEEALANGREAMTEYLNAQERRIVHVTLREDARVKTYALGDGMIKRLAVAPADYEGPRGED